MKIFEVEVNRETIATALYTGSMFADEALIVDSGSYYMKKAARYIYWTIVNGGNRPFVSIEIPNDPTLRNATNDVLVRMSKDSNWSNIPLPPRIYRRISTVIPGDKIYSICYPSLNKIRLYQDILPTFEEVTKDVHNILEAIEQEYIRLKEASEACDKIQKEMKKTCDVVLLNNLYDKLKKAQKDAVEKELTSIFEKDLDAVVNGITINSSRSDPFDPLFTIETKIDVYPSDDRNLNKIVSDAGKAFCDGVWDALRTEAEEAIFKKNLKRALNDYYGLGEDFKA